MTTITIENKIIEENLINSGEVSFKSLENIILKNFIKKQIQESLFKENYSKEDIDNFAQDYLDSFDKENLISI